tara:strand:- start:118 stop:342 length:225 start_codon:yes stop_codon:yes gene_type:complete
MSSSISAIATVIAEKLLREKEKKEKKKKKRMAVPPPTLRHKATKGTGYNRLDEKKNASKEIDADLKEIPNLEKL